jgi:Tfp pilus assembly protein PilX
MRHDDDGVALVIVLVFMLVVGLILGAAVTKATAVTDSGISLQDRTMAQYALDGGAERAIQLMKTDVATASVANPATLCTAPAAAPVDITTEAGGLTLNGHAVHYSCQTLAGKTANQNDPAVTNFAVVLTDSGSDALTTQSGQANGQSSTCANPAGALKVGGSVYFAGDETDNGATKRVIVCGGDLVQSSVTCTDAGLAALTNVVRDPGYLKACTEETLATAVPTVALPQAPTVDLGATFAPLTTPLYEDIAQSGDTCRVFYPGLYQTPPALLTSSHDGNYFVSGLYYFKFPNNNDTLNVQSNTTVTMGDPSKRPANDATASGSSPTCDAMSDATAMADLPGLLPLVDLTPINNAYFANGGVEMVFGAHSKLSVAGNMTVNTAPTPANTAWISLVAARGSTQPGQTAGSTDINRGYTAYSDLNHDVLSNQSASSTLIINGKVVAPSADIAIFASNPTDGVLRGGVIANDIDLGASVQGGGLAISAPAFINNPAPPPFRTVRIVSSEPGGTNTTNVVEAKISNFSPFTVTVLSWRTN